MFSNPGAPLCNYIPPVLSIILMSLTLTGCMAFRHESPRDHSTPVDSVTQSKHTKPDTESIKPDNAGIEDAMLKRCESELQALKVVSPDDYHRQTILFAKLMTTASQYANVRSQADPLTVAAVDALYQYRTSRVCADISWRLLNALSDKGEGRQ
ncbi:hypothetical protein ACTUSN_23545 [Pantoea ananatis]